VFNPFLHRAKLGLITLVTAAGMLGSRATIKFIDRSDIDKIWQWAERGHRNAEDFTEGN
jgi:putative membrane protein